MFEFPETYSKFPLATYFTSDITEFPCYFLHTYHQIARIKTAPGIWREQLRFPPPSTTWAWTRPDHHPWGQPRCSWNVRGSPPTCPPLPCSMWWVLISDTVSEQNWKHVPLQLVRHAGPTLTRGLAPAALGIVPGKAESGLPRPVFLTHWDSINGSSSQHFCSFNMCVSKAPTRRKGSLKRGKTEELLQSLVQTRVKEDKNVNMLRSLYLLTFAGGAAETLITCYSRLWDGQKEMNKEVQASKKSAI